MDLFEYMAEQKKKDEAPLASRMRPETLDEVVGQEHIIGKDKLLYRAIKADKLSSLIFYGPPGTGKTTLARVIANTTSADFEQVNATIAGKKDLEEVVAKAKQNAGGYGRKTILFIDEIHRFNKSQQDYLLPYVEDGTLILIGATTENPYFEVNGALLSRSRIFELKPLSDENVATLIDRALSDTKKGVGSFHADITEDAKHFLSDCAGGDARAALNAIELAVLTTDRASDGAIHITLPVAEQCIQRKAIRYDKDGDNHYDTISAFIKSMRGSDPDAAVYYLARMLEAGEDIKMLTPRRWWWRQAHFLPSSVSGCPKPRSFCPRPPAILPPRRSPTPALRRSRKRQPRSEAPAVCRFRPIFRMHIIAEVRSYPAVSVTFIHMISLEITSNNSTCRTKFAIRSIIIFRIRIGKSHEQPQFT